MAKQSMEPEAESLHLNLPNGNQNSSLLLVFHHFSSNFEYFKFLILVDINHLLAS